MRLINTVNNKTYRASHPTVTSYQRAIAPRPPGRHGTVVVAGQQADLGSGWHFLLITQTVVHTAGLPSRCSLLHTPSEQEMQVCNKPLRTPLTAVPLS